MEYNLHKESEEVAGMACCQIIELSIPIKKVWKLIKWAFILGAKYEQNKSKS